MRNTVATPTTVAHPMLAYQAEMQFACLYAMRRPKLAAAAARHALHAAHAMRNPALAYQANQLLALVSK